MSDATEQPLLEVRGLQKFFPITRGFLQRTVTILESPPAAAGTRRIARSGRGERRHERLA